VQQVRHHLVLSRIGDGHRSSFEGTQQSEYRGDTRDVIGARAALAIIPSEGRDLFALAPDPTPDARLSEWKCRNPGSDRRPLAWAFTAFSAFPRLLSL
jgi:hypothetical protein